MKRYIVTAIRTVRQRVSVEVFADDAITASELVKEGYAPLQWPDGYYLDRLRPADEVKVEPAD